MNTLPQSILLMCCTISLFCACKKDKESARFPNTTWDGTFVHSSSNPSTEEPFRMRFGSNDSLVFDYLDGTLMGAYSLVSGGQKIHIDVNKGELIMEATLKGGDSLVSFDNIKTGKFSFKRAFVVTPDMKVPTGTWFGLYSMASTQRLTFISSTEVRLYRSVFVQSEWTGPYSLEGTMFRTDVAGAFVGKFFGIIRDSVCVGSFKHAGSVPRTSFLWKKQP